MALIKTIVDKEGHEFLLKEPVDVDIEGRGYVQVLVEIMQKLGVLTPVEKEA